jgi:hypothetical protein
MGISIVQMGLAMLGRKKRVLSLAIVFIPTFLR